MKRIGIFVQCFPVPSETFIIAKVIGLMRMGYDVKIFTNRKSVFWDNYNYPEIKELRKRVLISPIAWYGNLPKFLFHLTQTLLKKAILHPVAVCKLVMHIFSNRKDTHVNVLIQFINKLMFVGEKIDVLHIEFDFQAYGIADLKEYLKCKLVLSGRGSIRSTSALNTFANFSATIYKYVDHYHFISHYLHSEAIKEGLNGHTPISLIEPAIDLSLFNPGKRHSNNPVICLVAVGRLTWAKGYEFAMDAVARVSQVYPNIRYVILGDGEYREAVMFAAEQNGLVGKGTVEFAGRVDRDTLPSYLQNADIMIHSALSEGFCNAVIEAQAMGLPVVCSDAGGLPENVEDGITGFVVPRRDVKALTNKVLDLIKNPEVRTEMGKMGRKRAIEKFDLENQILKFHHLYQSL